MEPLNNRPHELDTLVNDGRGWRAVPAEFAIHEKQWRDWKRRQVVTENETYSPYATAWRVGVQSK